MNRYRHRMGTCSSCLFGRHGTSSPGLGTRGPTPTDSSRRGRVMPLDSSAFTVKDVNLLTHENALEHRTTDFYASGAGRENSLIIRRGSPFTLQVLLNQVFIERSDVVNFVFTVADVDSPSYSKGTEVIVPLTTSPRTGRRFTANTSLDPQWTAILKGVQGNLLTVSITSSPSAIVGEWKLRIETREAGIPLAHQVDSKIYILFNPWNKKDAVYLPNEREREEYVLNQQGIIYRGVHNVIRPTPWSYGQFEDYVLECCCLVLSYVGYLHPADRGDPVKVTRHIAAVVNSHDEKGVVEGNWTTDYTGGKAPTLWIGSASILQQYFRTRRPVRYGQCWTFAGVATTICRTLGIPSRCVTNYQSAHDTHKSLTVDRFFSTNLEALDDRNRDSIWTFHTWTEIWMRRDDLPRGYDGWQVIDATPQEISSGLFRCGPASVLAVKRGEIQYPYDTAFVYAEVNADELFWMFDTRTQSYKLLDFKTDSVGKNLSTKAVGSNAREDITDLYKNPEKSREEREVMQRVLRNTKHMFARYYLNDKFVDIRFHLLPIGDIVIGESFTVRFRIENISLKVYTVVGAMFVRTTYYTGEPHSLVKEQRTEIVVPPEATQEMSMLVNFNEYEKHLADQNSFEVSVAADVVETNFQFQDRDDFRVRMPDIRFEFEGDAIVGKPLTVHAILDNPIPRTLTHAYFLIEGAGLTDPLKVPVKRNVSIGGEARVLFTITPKSPGDKTISAKFISKELGPDVDGFRNLRVSPSYPYHEGYDWNENIL